MHFDFFYSNSDLKSLILAEYVDLFYRGITTYLSIFSPSTYILLVSVCVYQYSIRVAAMSSCVQSTKYASQILTSQLEPSPLPLLTVRCKHAKSTKVLNGDWRRVLRRLRGKSPEITEELAKFWHTFANFASWCVAISQDLFF